MNKQTAFSFCLAACMWPASCRAAAPAYKIEIVSLKDSFSAWSRAADKAAPADRAGLFSRYVIEPNGRYFRALVFDDMQSDKKRDALTAAAAAKYYGKRTELLEAFDYTVAGLRELSARFTKALPAGSRDMKLVVMPSLGRFNGRENGPGGLAGFGVEFFTKDWRFGSIDRKKELPVAAAHEMFHVYHSGRSGISQSGARPVLTWIWVDGLATYASRLLTPGASEGDVLMDDTLAVGCAAWYKTYASAVKPVLDSVSEADQGALFDFGKRYKDLPTRAGYCIGLKAAEQLASQGRTLDEMSGWPEQKADAELRRVLLSWQRPEAGSQN